nr:methyltransferase, FxLD system [Streptomyces sp. NBC_00899]
MTHTTRDAWEQHYRDGKDFRPLGDRERELLAEHAPLPAGGGRAIEVGCGTGDLAAYLATGLGYEVDAVDLANSAIARAAAEHEGVTGVNWLRLDVEHDDPVDLSDDAYDLVALRLVVPFLQDRSRVLHALVERLRPDGALVVITPVAAHTPPDRRSIALDEDEIALLSDGWACVQRHDADGLAVLVLRDHVQHATRPVERKGPLAGPAVTGALAVVTDAAGRVLLGRSRRGMWELPGGKNTGAESFEAAAVRELTEETGLIAAVEDAHLVAMLADDRGGVPRLTAAVRVTSWSGALSNPEPGLFVRWEWHELHTLACLGDLFVPAAQVLAAVWPGIIPGLPPVHAYELAGEQPPVPGEPAQAVRLRAAMVEGVIAGGWAPSARVQQALRAVARHRFTPETDPRTAYANDVAVVTRRNEADQATSSVSASWLQADMIEHLGLEPGACVYEAGSGGYNAALLAHVVGPGGTVVTGDIDPYIVHRTRRLSTEAGTGPVVPVQGDAAGGAPAGLVPRGGFDAMMITYNAWDVAPPWRLQLAEGARLVLPLEIHGYTRAITFQRCGEVLRATHFTHCGFVPAQGEHTRTTPAEDLLDGELQVRFDDGEPGSIEGLENALRGPRHEAGTGVTMGDNFYFGSLQLYAATTLSGFCRLRAHRERGHGVTQIAKDTDAPAVLGDASLAYLIYTRIPEGQAPPGHKWEFVVHAFGQQGPQLAQKLAATVQDWDRHVRDAGDPVLTVHPAGTPDEALPVGHVLDKPLSRLVFQWPGTDVRVPAPASRSLARAAGTEPA